MPGRDAYLDGLLRTSEDETFSTRFWGGLFGKYVAYFVGFAVFILIVNISLETWFTYREATGA